MQRSAETTTSEYILLPVLSELVVLFVFAWRMLADGYPGKSDVVGVVSAVYKDDNGYFPRLCLASVLPRRLRAVVYF